MGDERTDPQASVRAFQATQRFDPFDVDESRRSYLTSVVLHHQVGATGKDASIPAKSGESIHCFFDALGRQELHDHRLQTAADIDCNDLITSTGRGSNSTTPLREAL